MAQETPEQGEGGRWTERVAVDDVLDVFDAVAGPPVITSHDVATHLDCSSDTARRKLQSLRDRGEITNREAGRTVLWYPTAEVEEGSDDA